MCFFSIQIKSYKIKKGSKAKIGFDAAFKPYF
jgi:hypothetical protein